MLEITPPYEPKGTYAVQGPGNKGGLVLWPGKKEGWSQDRAKNGLVVGWKCRHSKRMDEWEIQCTTIKEIHVGSDVVRIKKGPRSKLLLLLLLLLLSSSAFVSWYLSFASLVPSISLISRRFYSPFTLLQILPVVSLFLLASPSHSYMYSSTSFFLSPPAPLSYSFLARSFL